MTARSTITVAATFLTMVALANSPVRAQVTAADSARAPSAAPATTERPDNEHHDWGWLGLLGLAGLAGLRRHEPTVVRRDVPNDPSARR